MGPSAIGMLCLVFFPLSQGIRDAFFGNVFQSVSFLVVAVLAFSVSTVCFCASSALRRPGDLARLFSSPVAFAALNLATGLAWLSFFYGLKHLEPAVVATIFNGVGPLCVLFIQAFGLVPAKRAPSALERLLYLGIFISLVMLVAVVLSDRSGVTAASATTQAIALLALVFGGALTVISHMIARRFNDSGVGSDALMGTRFLFAIVLAMIAEHYLGRAELRPVLASVPLLAVAAFALITIPSFMLQLGIARASALTVNVARSLAPVFVFAVQQIDDRLQFSGATLGCIVLFCVFTTGVSVLRAWSEATSGNRLSPAR